MRKSSGEIAAAARYLGGAGGAALRRFRRVVLLQHEHSGRAISFDPDVDLALRHGGTCISPSEVGTKTSKPGKPHGSSPPPPPSGSPPSKVGTKISKRADTGGGSRSSQANAQQAVPMSMSTRPPQASAQPLGSQRNLARGDGKLARGDGNGQCAMRWADALTGCLSLNGCHSLSCPPADGDAHGHGHGRADAHDHVCIARSVVSASDPRVTPHPGCKKNGSRCDSFFMHEVALLVLRQTQVMTIQKSAFAQVPAASPSSTYMNPGISR